MTENDELKKDRTNETALIMKRTLAIVAVLAFILVASMICLSLQHLERRADITSKALRELDGLPVLHAYTYPSNMNAAQYKAEAEACVSSLAFR